MALLLACSCLVDGIQTLNQQVFKDFKQNMVDGDRMMVKKTGISVCRFKK